MHPETCSISLLIPMKIWTVMEARTLWMQELHKQTKVESDWLGRNIYHKKTDSDILREDFPGSPSYMLSDGMPFKSFDFETVKSSMSRYRYSEKCPSLSSETHITGESAVEENSAVDAKDLNPPRFHFQSSVFRSSRMRMRMSGPMMMILICWGIIWALFQS